MVMPPTQRIKLGLSQHPTPMSLIGSLANKISFNEDTYSDSDMASSCNSDSSAEDIAENISDDPFFATCGSLFNSEDLPDIDPNLEERDLPPVFYDHPAI
jgi:hypothetical protein